MTSPPPADCIFCHIVSRSAPAEILHEDDDTLAFLDIYPATRGHTLVIPKRHIEDIYGMPEELGAKIMSVAIGLSKNIKRRLSADGLNLLQSNEVAGGQTVFHFHVHIVPRYAGDPVVFRFGHRGGPVAMSELQPLALLIRSGPGGG